MNECHLVSMDTFQFSSLRKFMRPLYSELRFRENESPESKKAFSKSLIPKFFRRVREYRNKTILDIAKHSGQSIETVELFESGIPQLHPTVIEWAYVEVCSASQEVSYFFELLEEFRDPTIRDTRREMALEVLKRFGTKMNTVRYDTLNQQHNNVIEFKGETFGIT